MTGTTLSGSYINTLAYPSGYSDATNQLIPISYYRSGTSPYMVQIFATTRSGGYTLYFRSEKGETVGSKDVAWLEIWIH